MRTVSSTIAGKAIEKYMNEVSEHHEPIQIISKNKKVTNGILISEDDWKALSETLYLLSIPGMRQSIRKGLSLPLDKTSDKLEW